jgi:hypothetical protein
MAEAESKPGDFFAEFAPGQYVFKEGDSGTEMFIIDQGTVEIVRGSGKAERRLALLEHGDFFGEMAILEDLPRGASARAVESCRVLKIGRATFSEMLRENPEIAVRMMRKLSRRLRDAAVQAPEPAAAESPTTNKIAQGPAGDKPKLSFIPQQPAKKVAPKAEAPRPEPPPPAKLVEKSTGQEFTLSESGDSSIGRFDSVTGLAPAVDLTSVDTTRSTSRRHAKVVRDGGKFFVYEEVGTANGTFVNGKRITTGDKVEIKEGDEIRFGSVTLTFKV